MKRRPRKFGIGFALRQTMSLRIQKPRSCTVGADAENIVIRADHPQRAGRRQQPAAGGEPGAGEMVVFGEAAELVPVFFDAVDPAVVGPVQVAAQLQVVGRVGEDEIDAPGGQLRHRLEAVALDHRIAVRQRRFAHSATVSVVRESVNDSASIGSGSVGNFTCCYSAHAIIPHPERLSLQEWEGAILKQMARPVRKGDCRPALVSLHQRIRSRVVLPGQDGDPRSLILIIISSLRRAVWFLRFSELPFDCQAIFLSPHADFGNPPASLFDAGR